ncbi:AAA family ATPase [Alcaligenaceae bacterium]|nr:AAA family ATPase [Alcaligenaceae bacterium]
MRFDAIELVRYGHFSGHGLRFPRRDCDFHLIVGRNEAGKSTLRQAFHDLLFGIPMDTAMSFLYPGTELELGAVLSGGPGELAFGRRRRRNGGLIDAAGEPLAADALHAWLGEVNAAFYERMFGLDHRRLERGSRAMLQAGDNVDSVLFQAASGVSALNGVLDALGREATALWAPRRSRDRAWYAAADRLAEADAALKAATVRPAAWVDAQRESRLQDEAFARAQAEHAGLVAQVQAVERLRRIAPLLAQIRRYEALLDDAGGADAAGGAPLRAHEADILALKDARLRLADHGAGIERGASRMELLRSQLGQVLRQLGRPVLDADHGGLESLAGQLPSLPLRQEIAQLLREGRDVLAQGEAAERALDERRAELARLRAEIDAQPAAAVGQPLRRALEAAAAAGSIETQLDGAHRNGERERAALERRLDELAQPGVAPPADPGEAVAWLARMEPWQTPALNERVQRRQQFQAEIDTLDKRVREAGIEQQAAELALEQFRRSRQAVSRDDIFAARGDRDRLWQAIAQGSASLETEAARFGVLLRHADTLADLHLQAVGDAARLQSLQHELERRTAALEGLRGSRSAAAQALAVCDAEWAQACRRRHLPILPPPDLQGWLAGRDAALMAHERLQAARSETAALERRHEAVLGGLMAALAAERRGGDGMAADPGGEEPAPTLAGAQECARALLERAGRAEARRQALAEQSARIESLLPGLEKDAERLAGHRSQWRRRWRDALLRAGLPQDSEAAFVEAAVALLADADELAGQLRECHAQRARMESELEGFGRAAQALALRLRDADFDPAAVHEHVRRWVLRLEQAQAAERSREEARQRLAELSERLLQEGEGRSRPQIEAELESIDVAALAGRAEALRTALQHAASVSSRLAVEREQARKALEAISGGDTAAHAAARRQEALADMADIAERYVRLYTEQRLLERVTERYRERRQGPLLARAGQLFSELTLGAHAGLEIDHAAVSEARTAGRGQARRAASGAESAAEGRRGGVSPGEAAVLHARRADGGVVPLDGLSDGTRDQLYLALRIAALELYLDHAAPLPFIADDLFVNYDDQRAVAGLRKLAAVARRTQIIFLTHHAHMVELAREALAGQLHVIELPGQAGPPPVR